MTILFFVTYNTHTVGQDSEQDGKWPYSGRAGAIDYKRGSKYFLKSK